MAWFDGWKVWEKTKTTRPCGGCPYPERVGTCFLFKPPFDGAKLEAQCALEWYERERESKGKEQPARPKKDISGKAAGEIMQAQISELFKRLDAQGHFQCPRCREDYARPMNEHGICGPCEIDAEKEEKDRKARAASPGSNDVAEIIGGWKDNDWSDEREIAEDFS